MVTPCTPGRLDGFGLRGVGVERGGSQIAAVCPGDWDLDWPDKQKFYSLQPPTNSLKNGGPGRRHERS